MWVFLPLKQIVIIRLWMESPEILFPACDYLSVHAPDMSLVDLEKYEKVKSISLEIRKLFRILTTESPLNIQYAKILEIASSLGWRMPPWCAPIDWFFINLREFLSVSFLVKESDGIVQDEYLTNFNKILSDSAREHIHSFCPFHMEDNFTHCFMTMAALLSNSLDYSPTILFQKGICALLHDIGKGNTRCLVQKKNGCPLVSYPCHCLAGSIILRHIWGDYFSKWFGPNEWDLMCDVILYHMCGCNRDPDAISMTLISHLPTPLRTELYELAKADIRGALPLESYFPAVQCLADDQTALEELELRAKEATSFEGLIDPLQ